ncbi:sporulation membrane protein YtaF [Brevibacillus ginsengisoli]|uniref:sporulation membrane protein YtaF n=1 Tax=Brevibacillus ginsengisoli TaxID=363854 RepID=UPI003CF1873D
MMGGWISLLILSVAIGLDGLSVGVTYGLRRMNIPLHSLCVIGFCSMTVVFSVMTVGNTFLHWITPAMSQKLGASILILIGFITLWRMYFSKDKKEELPGTKKQPSEHPMTQIRIFGLIIQILRDPSYADSDQSGHISGWEAVTLGLALSLDAFGAGISFALLGYPPLLTASFVAVTSAFLLFFGLMLGRRFEKFRWFQSLTWLPPVMLICIGLLKGVS